MSGVSEGGRTLSETTRTLPSRLIFSDILGLVGPKLSAVEAEVARNLHSEIGVIDELGTYLFNGGGKRVRPLLLLLSAQMAGYRGERDVLFASVFEFIHTATLVHDDVIDGATIRRGRSSLNAAWGNSLTVLLGDYLYIKSMSMALTADDLRIIKLLADITLKMIEGELIQKRRQGDISVTAEEHLEIVRRKTAFLFSGCSRVGALLARSEPEQEAALESFGMNLGMAFQLVDDLLDFTSDEKTLGKPVISDLREGKLTLPLIYLLEEGRPEHKGKVQQVLEDGDFSHVESGEILELVRAHGTLEKTRDLARRFGERARGDLRHFPDNLARRALETLPDLILARDR
jgi:octaprenyl-diphosphate synthase